MSALASEAAAGAPVDTSSTPHLIEPIQQLLARVGRYFVEFAVGHRMLAGSQRPHKEGIPGGYRPISIAQFLQVQEQGGAFSGCRLVANVLADLFAPGVELPSSDVTHQVQNLQQMLSQIVERNCEIPRGLVDDMRSTHRTDNMLNRMHSAYRERTHNHAFFFQIFDASQLIPWATEDAIRSTQAEMDANGVSRDVFANEAMVSKRERQATTMCSADHAFVLLLYRVPGVDDPVVLLLQASAYAYHLHDWMALTIPGANKQDQMSQATWQITRSNKTAKLTVGTCFKDGKTRGAHTTTLGRADAYRRPFVCTEQKWQRLMAQLRTVCTAQEWTEDCNKAFLQLFGVHLAKPIGSSLGYRHGETVFPSVPFYSHSCWTNESVVARMAQFEKALLDVVCKEAPADSDSTRASSIENISLLAFTR